MTLRPSGTAPRRLLISGDAIGGVWRYTLELAAGLAAFGTETVFAVLGPAPGDEQLAEARAVAGLRLLVTHLPPDWTAGSPAVIAETGAALARLAEQIEADLTQLNMPAHAAQSSWPTPLAVAAHSCVATWWRAIRRGAPPADFAWRSAATQAGLHAADAVIAPSRSFARALAEIYGERPISVVYNGSDAPPAPVCPRRAVVLTAGRLWDEGKNIGVLDRAAARLTLPILAAGPVAAPRHGDAVRFEHLHLLGLLSRAALAAQMAEAAIFAAPSRYEPFGLAVLEAAQAGSPLLLSDIPTFRELWEGAAVFVPAEDPERWARAIGALIDAPEERRRLGRAARERSRRYGRAAMAARVRRIHDGILSPPSLLAAD